MRDAFPMPQSMRDFECFTVYAEATGVRLAPRVREGGPRGRPRHASPIDATAPAATCGRTTNPRQARRGATRGAVLRSRPITGTAAATSSACGCLAAPPPRLTRAHPGMGSSTTLSAAAVLAGHCFSRPVRWSLWRPSRAVVASNPTAKAAMRASAPRTGAGVATGGLWIRRKAPVLAVHGGLDSV